MEFKRIIKLRKTIEYSALHEICRHTQFSKVENINVRSKTHGTSINFNGEPIYEGNIAEIVVSCDSEELANQVFREVILEYGEIEDIRLEQQREATADLNNTNKEMLKAMKDLQ